jgi:hypothetical protein
MPISAGQLGSKFAAEERCVGTGDDDLKSFVQLLAYRRNCRIIPVLMAYLFQWQWNI